MAHGHTTNLNLIKLDPTVKPMSLSDLRAFFETNQDTIDANIKALFDRIEAVAAAGYTPIQPVNLPDSAFKVRIENASTRFDIPAMIAAFPPRTPVRITGFTITMSTVQEIVNFFELIKTMYGLDASNNGLDRIQMHGTIILTSDNSSNPLTVSGAQMRSWNSEFPSITVVPDRISNTIAYYNYDCSELLYTETIYDGADAGYSAVFARECEVEGHMYSFLGWSSSANSSAANAVLTNVTEDKNVYAAYAYLSDVKPTVTITTYCPGVNAPCTITLDSLGSYSKLVGIKSGSYSNVVGTSVIRINEDTITVTPDANYYAQIAWYLVFSDNSGSCQCEVPVNIKNVPSVIEVQKRSVASGDPGIIRVSFGDYATVVKYYCRFKRSATATGTSANITIDLALGSGVSVSNDIITITPDTSLTAEPVMLSQYVTFKNANNNDEVNIPVNIFNITY